MTYYKWWYTVIVFFSQPKSKKVWPCCKVMVLWLWHLLFMKRNSWLFNHPLSHLTDIDNVSLAYTIADRLSLRLGQSEKYFQILFYLRWAYVLLMYSKPLLSVHIYLKFVDIEIFLLYHNTRITTWFLRISCLELITNQPLNIFKCMWFILPKHQFIFQTSKHKTSFAIFLNPFWRNAEWWIHMNSN